MPNDAGRKLGRLVVAAMAALGLLLVIVLPAMSIAYPGYAQQASFAEDALLEIVAFGMLPFAWILLKGRESAVGALGLGRAHDLVLVVSVGVGIFGVVLGLSEATSIIGILTGTQISTNVNEVFAGAPLWFLVFAAFVGPVCEELFFRGFLIRGIGNVMGRSRAIIFMAFGAVNSLTIFLVTNSFYGGYPYAEAAAAVVAGYLIEYALLAYAGTDKGRSLGVGIVNSATIFGMLHAGYGSTFSIEVLAGITFGLVAGYVFVRMRSLYPSILAHIAVNSVAVVAMLVFVHW